MKKLQEEIDDHFNDINIDIEINYNKINDLNYLNIFVKEALRMFPTSPKYYNF